MRALVLSAGLVMSLSASQLEAAMPANYKVHDTKPMKDVLVQIVSFDAVPGLGQSAIKKINTALIAASALFGREAKECSAVAQGHLWGYELTLEKILLSDKYLSVVLPSQLCAQDLQI